MPAVTIDLPMSEGIGFVVDRGILEQMKANLGMTISENQLYTLIQVTIIGPSSGLNAHGRSQSWTLASKLEVNHLAWEHFNPLAVIRRLRTASSDVKSASDESNKFQDLLKDGSHELLLDALGDKVSFITMIDRDEITPDRNLLDYGLDSLFSLELRSWIWRRLNFNVVLKDIVSAKSLNVLVERITSQTRHSTPVSSRPRIEPSTNKATTADLTSEYPDLPLSPLLEVQDEERASIREHIHSIGNLAGPGY